MELVAWYVLGALTGYFTGSAIFEDEGVGVFGHVVVGSIAGVVAGFAAAVVLAIPQPVDTFNAGTVISAIVTAGLAVILVNGYAERVRLEI